MRSRTFRLVTGGFVAGLLILTINAALPYYNAARQSQTDAWVSRSYEVLRSINLLDNALLETETAQRGYLLTGLPAYKLSYEQSQANVLERFQTLAILSRDDAEQQAKLERLHELLNSTLQRFQLHMATFDDHGLDAARALVTERRKHRIAREFDLHMDQIQRSEERLLSARLSLAKAAAHKTLTSFFAITILNVLIFCGLFYAVTRAFKKSHVAETALKEQSNLQSSILNSMSEGLGVVDAKGDLILFNPAAEQLLGRKSDHIHLDQWPQVYGMLQADKSSFVDSEDLPLTKVLEGEPGRTVELFVRHPNYGSERQLSMTARAILDSSGKIQGGVAIFADVTDRKRQERVIQEANTRLTKNISDMKRRNDEVNSLNELSGLLQSCQSLDEAVELIAKSAESLFSDFSGSLYLMRPERDFLELTERWGQERSLADIVLPQECWCVRRSRLHHVKNPGRDVQCSHVKQAQTTPLHSVCAPLTAQGEVLGILFLEGKTADYAAPDATAALVTALCEQAGLALSNLKLRNTLKAQSDQDALTGLHNRRYLENALAREFARANRSKLPLALLILDIDHFKKFNDTFGHDTGDKVLKAFSQTIRSVVRTTDEACRYGGEEFVVLMPGTSQEGACECAERLLTAIREIRFSSPSGQLLGPFTASIGVAVNNCEDGSPERLLKTADLRLYEAKNQGRDRMVAGDSQRLYRPTRRRAAATA